MNSDPARSAILEAEQDWWSHSVRVLCGDHIYTTVPIIDSAGFYLRMSSKNRNYINAYNARIRQLLKEHGLPEWAPGRRVLNELELKSELKRAVSFTEFECHDNNVLRLINGHVRMWQLQHGVLPEEIIEFPDREILVLIGSDGESVRCDQIDLKAMTWMARSLLSK